MAVWQTRTPAWQEVQLALSARGIWIYGEINRLIQELDEGNRLRPEDIGKVKALVLAVAEDRRVRLEASITRAIADACGPVRPADEPAI